MQSGGLVWADLIKTGLSVAVEEGSEGQWKRVRERGKETVVTKVDQAVGGDRIFKEGKEAVSG